MQSVTPKEAHDGLAQEQGAILLDVRTPEEVRAMSIAGALAIPLGELGGRTSELAGYTKVFVFCLSGGRSARATRLLSESGVPAVNIAGGITAWKAAGLPTESAA